MTTLQACAGDERSIDELVGRFFALFSNRGGALPALRAIYGLCIPQAVITKCTPSGPEVMSLDSFIAPRDVLLKGGTLVEFHEFETEHRTEIFGSIAQRSCVYEKAGALNGTPFRGRGRKLFQFVKTNDGWRIASVAWEDD